MQIALPNKGALAEETLRLVTEAGYRCRPGSRELSVCDPDNGVDFVFLRPRDIPVYISGGVIDVGITGRDLTLERGAEVAELLPLGFGRAAFRYAVPVGSELTPENFAGCRIATSYPNLVMSDLRRRNIPAEIVQLDGAVEISVKLGVADLIADVVQTGRTLVEAGLATVGEPVLLSEAVVIAADAGVAEKPQVRMFIERLRGVVVARDYVMIEYDIPAAQLPAACAVTPGIESPTVSPLQEADWKAVKAMAKRHDVNRIMDELSRLGAKGIIVTDIRTCRI
jgi:ATP phosphoribosyltransferase